MQVYEIRVLRSDHSSAFVLEAAYLNDNAAVRAARKLAENRKFEVWRDLYCVYGVPNEHRSVSAEIGKDGRESRTP